MAVRADGIRTFIYVDRGELVFAEEESAGETLGRMLLRQGKLTEQQYALVIKRMTDAIFDNEQLRFGEVAVALGLLTADEVQRALADQVRWKIIRALQRSSHEFAFEESTGQVEGVVHFALHLEALILEASRWVPDENKLAALEQAPKDRYLRLRDPITAIAERYVMTPEERAFLEKIDGSRTIPELVALGESDAADVPALIIALLWAQGVVASSTKAATIATPPTPPQFAPYKDLKDAAKEKADRAIALLRQQRAQQPATAPSAFKPVSAPQPAPPKDEREARLLAAQAFQRGKLHLFGGQHKLAQSELERARSLLPESTEYELFALWAAFVTGEKADAAARAALGRAYAAAIKADPNCAFGYFVMGEMALYEKNETTAIKAFKHAVKLDPNLIEPQRRLRLLVRK